MPWMNEATRQINIARRAISLATEWLERAEATIESQGCVTPARRAQRMTAQEATPPDDERVDAVKS